MRYILQIQGLTKNFENTRAVKNISFSIAGGEIFSLIGPNGSGKTTIIKSIVGLLRPSAGRIRVGGTDASEDPVTAKGKIGYIPDNPEIWNSITGEEFLYITGALYGMERREVAERIPELLSIFSLEGVEKNYFQDYSRGNKQKFTILAALLHRPHLLLIDEPIVGLDPISADIAQKEFQKFTEKGGAILLATHTLSVAEEISHRIGFLKEGKITTRGDLGQLQKKARLSSKAKLKTVYKKLT